MVVFCCFGLFWLKAWGGLGLGESCNVLQNRWVIWRVVTAVVFWGLCYAILCYAIVCYAILCDAILCYAILCLLVGSWCGLFGYFLLFVAHAIG